MIGDCFSESGAISVDERLKYLIFQDFVSNNVNGVGRSKVIAGKPTLDSTIVKTLNQESSAFFEWYN